MRFVNGIRIREEKPFAAGRLRALVHGMVLSGPSLRQGFTPEDTDPVILLLVIFQALQRTVDGPVIQENKFQTGVILAQEAWNDRIQIVFFVPAGNDDRNKVIG